MISPSKNYDEVANILAQAHREADPDTFEVRLARDPKGKVIRLLEVSKALFTTNGEVLPFEFPANGDMPFLSVVAVISPAEWDMLQQGRIKLPKGWGSFRDLQPVPAA